MHHGVKGMKWGVRHDPEPSGRQRRASANKEYRDRVKAAGKKNLKAFKENYGSREARRKANQEFRSEVKAAKQANKDAFGNIVKSARSNFAKGVGQTYRVNEFVEKKKEKAWSKASDKPVIGKYASKKQNTAKENAKFYEKTRTDLTSGKVAPAKTKYQKFVRAMFKNPVGKAWTINAIKTSPYLKTGQQKATALAEVGLMDNFYAEQKRLKKEGKPYYKY